MKTIFINIVAIITLFSALNINAFAQNSNDSVSHGLNSQPLAYTQYLKKSHDQKVTATVLAIGGTVMLAVGISLAAASLNGLFDPNVRHHDYGSAPDILSIGGVTLIATAIPFQLASRRNKKLAKLYINKENVMIIPQTSTAVRLTCIGIKINL